MIKDIITEATLKYDKRVAEEVAELLNYAENPKGYKELRVDTYIISENHNLERCKDCDKWNYSDELVNERCETCRGDL